MRRCSSLRHRLMIFFSFVGKMRFVYSGKWGALLRTFFFFQTLPASLVSNLVIFFYQIQFLTLLLFLHSAVPFHSPETRKLTAILCEGQLSERWMDPHPWTRIVRRCVPEWRKINCSVQYQAVFSARLRLQKRRRIIIIGSTFFQVSCFLYADKRNLFDQDNGRKKGDSSRTLQQNWPLSSSWMQLRAA